MRKPKIRVSVEALKSSQESVWIVDVAIIHSAGERFYCALVQDLKKQRVLGWATASDFAPSLLIRAVEVACNRSVRTCPATLYLNAGYENAAPAVIAELSCLEFQVRLIEPHQQVLLKGLEPVWRDLQVRFTAEGAAPHNDDWFD